MGYRIHLSRRRAKLWFLLFVTLWVFAYLYYSPHWQVPNIEEEKPVAVKEKKELSRVGEKIVFDVMMGKLRLGQATYQHLEVTELNGKKVNVISFLTELVRFRDRETIYCDPETFLPYLVERKISRLLKQEYIDEEYDQEKFILKITKKRFGKSTEIIKKDKPINNAILLPYYARNYGEIEPGWSFKANLPQRDFEIFFVDFQAIKVPGGEFKAYYFESQPKQIKIWISADKYRVPLRIEGTGGIGYKLLMKEYSPPAAE
ncbi:MAG: DUF3108 domain-containing protein [Candidatus Omnitrophota bacterium]